MFVEKGDTIIGRLKKEYELDQTNEYTITTYMKLPEQDRAVISRYVEAIANRDTIRADFAVQVDGHSIEPLYSDGGIVLVHRQLAIDIGDIGVFAANDKEYIKKQGDDRLISINPDYPNVEPEECCGYKYFGQVISVLDTAWIVR